MNKLSWLLAGLLIFAACTKHKAVDYARFKALQDYGVPLDAQPFPDGAARRAMFIFPHADDEVAHAGTIAYLKSLGAQVKLLTLTQGHDDEERNTRTAELRCAVRALGIDSFRHRAFYTNTWAAVVQDSILYWNENLPAIQAVIAREIAAFRPHSVYVYDTLYGGYGHHEHLLTSKATFRAIGALRRTPAFSVRRVYMSTLPERLDSVLLKGVATYALFRQKNRGRGKPAPNVAYDITRHWPAKQAAALCHASQEHVMRNFYLKPQGNDSLHYHTFDREYYYLTKF